LGSKLFKDSRDIKFAKFGQVDYFLWILQLLGKIDDLKYKFKTNLTQLTGGADWAATWRDAIRHTGSG
jgi:hypothetical protein